MTVKHINPENVGKPAGPYTNVVETEDYVFISGQAPIEPKSGKLISGTFQEEAVLVFENIKNCLSSRGLSLADVVKVNAYLGELSYRQEFNELYQKYFQPPYPARTTIGCNLGGIKIEVDVIAYKGKEKK